MGFLGEGADRLDREMNVEGLFVRQGQSKVIHGAVFLVDQHIAFEVRGRIPGVNGGGPRRAFSWGQKKLRVNSERDIQIGIRNRSKKTKGAIRPGAPARRDQMHRRMRMELL